MTAPVTNPKPLAELQADPAAIQRPAVPPGIGAAPTVLEAAPQNASTAKQLEPGFFETVVLGIKNLLILFFQAIWSCLCRKREEPETKIQISVTTTPSAPSLPAPKEKRD